MKKSIYFLFSIFLFCSLQFTHAQVITTFAGNGTTVFSGDGGLAISAGIPYPAYIASDSLGDLFIAEGTRIRRVNPTGIITTIAGTGTPGLPSGDGGPASAAVFSSLQFIAADKDGNVYVSDNGYYVRKIGTSGIITGFAGVSGIHSFGGDGGPATAALMFDPDGLAADGTGNVYICDGHNERVRMVNPAGIINTIAGDSVAIIAIHLYGGDGGPATDAQVIPWSLATDPAGNLFIVDNGYGVVRKVNTAGIITTYAGIPDTTASPGFSGDSGPATNALLNNPWGIATDTSGNLYICDNGNDRIRKVDAAGIITTIAGNGSTGFMGDGGPATTCEFNNPYDIVWQAGCGSGSLYISDHGNSRIRRIVLNNYPPTFIAGHTFSITTCPVTISIDSMLVIADSNTGQPETWAVLTPTAHGTLIATYSAISTGGAITPTGLSYTPATGYAGTDTFRVSIIDCGNVPDTANFYINVLPLPIAVSISGPDTVCPGSSVILTDTITGGIWFAVNTIATISADTVTGITVGVDTIFYSISNTCGADTAAQIVTVEACTEEVTNINPAGTALTIFPNPNDGNFTLSVTTPTNEQATITISNILGEKVKQLNTTANTPTQVKMEMPEGVYFISATTASGRWNEKVVVSNSR